MRAVSADPATVLAVETISLKPTDQLAILHLTDPQLVLSLGKAAASTAVYDLSLTTLEKVRQQAQARSVSGINVYEDVFPEGEKRFDVALMVVPKGRGHARAMMMAARRILKPGGLFYVVGPTDGGAKTCIQDMATIFGNAATLRYKKRNRVGVSTQPAGAAGFPAAWGEDPTREQERTIAGFTLRTMPGIFSWEELDAGTALLLDHVGVAGGESALDVGCGNGVLGLALLRAGATSVTMTDDNLLAVRCARANSAVYPNRAEVLPGDVFEPVAGRTFDLIVSNPPFHQKFDVNTNVAHRIIRGAYEHLTPGGRLVIVANSFLKYDEVMAESLARVRVLIDNGRYVVIEGRRPEKGTLGKATAAAQGKRGSKRRSELDEAQRFRQGGEIRTVPEEELAGEATDDEIDRLFAELDEARDQAVDIPEELDEADFEDDADWEDGEFEDGEDDDQEDGEDDTPPAKPGKPSSGRRR